MSIYVLFFLFVSLNSVKSDIISDQIYLNITNAIPCVRRLNLTHQIGCGNLDESNYYGVVYYVKNETDLININEINFNELYDKKLIVATVPSMFKNVVGYYLNTDSKRADKRLNGIVLLSYDEAEQATKYSDDARKPNQKFSFYNDQTESFNNISWNDIGSNYMFERIKIPFYLILNSTEGASIVDCYDRFNRDFLSNSKVKSSASEQLCGMQLGLQMYAAVNSRVCIRRNTIMHTLDSVDGNSICDPLGGYNFYSYLTLKPSSTPSNLVLLSTQLDTFTLFEYYTPGASKPITSIISILSIADLLSNNRTDYKNELLYMLFSNEAFDYAGSSRFVYDLKGSTFPGLTINGSNIVMKSSDIKLIVELGEFGNLASNETNPNLWIHRDPLTYNSSDANFKALVDNTTTIFESASGSAIKRVRDAQQALPPSSIHSFLRLNVPVPSVLISDHEIEYKNKYFRSIYDKRENLNLEWASNITEEEAVNSNFSKLASGLQKHTTYISKGLYSMLTENMPTFTGQTDLKLINNLIYCFLYNPRCKLFQSIQTTESYNAYDKYLQAYLPRSTLSFYTTVTNQMTSGIFITDVLFRFLTREKLADNFNETECNLKSDSVKNLTQAQGRYYNLAIYMKTGNYYTNNRTLCILSSTLKRTSLSPAFLDHENGVLKNTDSYSAWTESSWEGKETQMKLFIFPTKTIESVTLTIGICVSVLSFVFTFLANKYLTKWLLTGEEDEPLNHN